MFFIESCPICGKGDFKAELSCADHTVSRETFQIISCTNCQFHLTNPRPSDAELGKYYLSENYISHSAKPKSIVDIIYSISRLFTTRWKIALIKRHIPKNNFALLDYGCGTGDFLQACLKNGVSTSGVEPSDKGRAIAQVKVGHHIYPNLSLVKNKFDAITLWHVLEHVPDLQPKISELKNLLTENGTIFIAVPNFESYDSKKFKELWAGYDVPRHLWHFSKRNMTDLLHNNGFTLKAIVPMKLDSYYVSILSNKYKNGGSTLKGFIQGMFIGLISNLKAAKNLNHSSLIYIASKK
jgi:SAM-dependent methyltransferase